MYHVVVFIETNEVEAIPVNWLKSNHEAYWPDSYSFSVLRRAIECNAQPDPNWKVYAVRLLKNGRSGETLFYYTVVGLYIYLNIFIIFTVIVCFL